MRGHDEDRLRAAPCRWTSAGAALALAVAALLLAGAIALLASGRGAEAERAGGGSAYRGSEPPAGITLADFELASYRGDRVAATVHDDPLALALFMRLSGLIAIRYRMIPVRSLVAAMPSALRSRGQARASSAVA